MRIIAGKFRSQPLLAPKGRDIRPTGDRLRETLFNVLAPRIQEAVFADLFAGTGAVGLEALSRGARQVYFAENANGSLKILHQNLDRFRVGDQARVEPAGTKRLLQRLVQEGIRLEIAFLDPPYQDLSAYKTTLQFLSEQPILAPDALVIAEHARRSPLPEISGPLQPYRRIEHGEAALTFFSCNINSESGFSSEGDR